MIDLQLLDIQEVMDLALNFGINENLIIGKGKVINEGKHAVINFGARLNEVQKS